VVNDAVLRGYHHGPYSRHSWNYIKIILRFSLFSTLMI